MVSVIVPTYKEALNIRSLAERLHTSLVNSSIDYEIIIVDDDSRDGIEAAVRELRAKSYPVKLIIRHDERGLSSAVIRGFQEAQGNILLCMDADLSHPPERVPDLVGCFADGECEFAIGSRYVSGGGADEHWGLFRRLNSRCATLLARPFTGVKDPMAGFFAIPRHVFNRAEHLCPIGFKIGLELLVKCRCRKVREIPIMFMRREHGKSKMGFKEQCNYVRHLKTLADFKYGPVSRFLQFSLVGASGMLIDLAAYWVLLRLGWGTYLARAVAIGAAMNWNFGGNVLITFHGGVTGKLLPRYLGFILSCSLGALLSWLVSTVLAPNVPYFREHLLGAAILGILAGAITNFGFCERVVFRGRRRRHFGRMPARENHLPVACHEVE